MNTLAFALSYLCTVAVLVLLYLVIVRRYKRLEDAAQHLRDLAGQAVIRHRWAQASRGADSWLVLERIMRDLDQAIEEWADDTD